MLFNPYHNTVKCYSLHFTSKGPRIRFLARPCVGLGQGQHTWSGFPFRVLVARGGKRQGGRSEGCCVQQGRRGGGEGIGRFEGFHQPWQLEVWWVRGRRGPEWHSDSARIIRKLISSAWVRWSFVPLTSADVKIPPSSFSPDLPLV